MNINKTSLRRTHQLSGLRSAADSGQTVQVSPEVSGQQKLIKAWLPVQKIIQKI